MLRPLIKRLTHLGPEAATQIAPVAGQVAMVEPGRARRCHLFGQFHIRSQRQSDTLAALAILEPAQFDDGTRTAIAARLNVGKFDMMGAAVDAVHDRIGGAGQFIMQATFHETAHHRTARLDRRLIVGRAPLDPAFAHRLVHPLDDVAALAKGAKRRFGISVQGPLTRRDLAGEPQTFEFAKASDPDGVLAAGTLARHRGHVDHAALLHGARKIAVDVRPALGIDLPFERPADVLFGSQPQFARDNLRCAPTHSLADIVARDDEVLAVVGDAAHDDVDMWIIGVPVRHTGPVEPRSQIFFHLRHQVVGEGFEVAHLAGILRADDEAEMVPVILAAPREASAVHPVLIGAEQNALVAVAGDAFALQIVEMTGQRGTAIVPDDARLDDDLPRVAPDPVRCAQARSTPAPESRAARRNDPSLARHMAASPARGGQRLGVDTAGPLAALRTDFTGSQAEVILAAHARRPRDVR